jgi:hypothetical protein
MAERLYDLDLEEHAPLQHLTIKMYGRTYEMQPAADLVLRPSTVGEDLQNQGARFAFYATCHAMALAKVKALEKKLESRRSELDQTWRNAGILPGGGKITEESMRRALRCDELCDELQDKILDAEFDANVLFSVVKAFEHRRDMLVELAKRANNITFHDRDVNVTVSAKISQLLSQHKNVGQHPSKK